MIYNIGFTNFRRFANFPKIDLGDVTILVGGNNSGKSTLVKALLLCVDNVRLMRMNDRHRNESNSPLLFSMPLFRFDANEYHDVKVKTFGRAIYNKPIKALDPQTLEEKLEVPSTITFDFTIGQFQFEIVVSGDRDDRKNVTTGDVEYISIVDMKSQVRYASYYASHSMTYEILNGDRNETLSLNQKLWNDFQTTKKALDDANENGDLDEIAEKATAFDKIEAQIKDMYNIEGDLDEEEILKNFISDLSKTVKTSYDLPLGIMHDKVAEPVVLNVISNILNFASSPKDVAPRQGGDEDPSEFGARLDNYNLLESYRRAMAQDVDIIRRSYDDLAKMLEQLNVEYISAHAANQNTLYNTADRNDYIAQTVHEFYREKINPGEREYEFIRKWMKEFEIGNDFEVSSIGGEAYQVRIFESDGSSVPLADKGMGSIQMMVLLLRLATILRRNPNVGMTNYRPIIVIEEPEQNLHPRMQSKLADLFYSLAAEDEVCRFLIETHSEYLIRRTQVIVAKEDYLDDDELEKMNTFKVYYLPNNGDAPYEMHYKLSGNFKEKFGEGFFDAATESEMFIIRKEFELNKKKQ